MLKNFMSQVKSGVKWIKICLTLEGLKDSLVYLFCRFVKKFMV